MEQVAAQTLPYVDPATAMAPQPAAAPDPAPPRPTWLLFVRFFAAVILSVAMGAGAFKLYTRGNDFPALYYHPDEWGKADQIIGTNEWNFRHPLLMLESANLMVKWRQVPLQRRPVEIAGRTAVAALAAIGVTAAAMTGFVGYGFIGLLLTGAIVGLCPPLLINAHFMKEDTALLCGFMVAILGARLVISSKFAFAQVLSAILLGIGVGMAASGKYIGVVTVVPALVTLVMARVHGWGSVPVRIAAMLAAALATAVFINQRAFVDWTTLAISDRAMSGFNYEREHVVEGHFNLELHLPNLFWLRTALSEVTIVVWAFFLVGLGWALHRLKAGGWAIAGTLLAGVIITLLSFLAPAVARYLVPLIFAAMVVLALWNGKFQRWGLVLAAFPLTFGILLSFNKIPMARYALPVTVGFYLIAAQLLASMFSDWYPNRRSSALAGTTICLVAAVALLGWRCWSIDNSFIHDSRHELREFAAKNVPSGQTIAVDNHSGLHATGDPDRHPEQTKLVARVSQNRMHAADAARTVDALAAGGTKYVAVSNMNFDRFFDPEAGGTAGQEQWFAEHRKFYEDLFTRGKLLWKSQPRYATHGWVDMDLRLYDISDLKPATSTP